MLKIGTIAGKAKLSNAYDDYAIMLLSPYFERIENDKKGSHTKYKIISQLPTEEEYALLKKKRFTQDADGLVSEAISEIETLAEEMREWFDNLTENLQSTDKGERVDEAANTLEGLSAPTESDVVAHIKIYHLPSLKQTSRADRCAEAVSILNSVSAGISDWIEANRPDGNHDSDKMEFKKDDGEVFTVDVNWDELVTYAQECDDYASEAEGVEFPGMYS